MLHPERSSVWLERRRHGALRRSTGLLIEVLSPTYEACNAPCPSVLTTEQDAILALTLLASLACYAIAALGCERREKIGRAASGDIGRAAQSAPDLPSPLVISTRMKATQVRSVFALRKKAGKVSAPHWQPSRVRYDASSGLATVAGRMKWPFTALRQAHRWLDHADGFAQTCCEARLVAASGR